jgi:hypothetical protein
MVFRSVVIRVAIWTLKRPNQPNLAVLKQFSRNKMFWPFFNLDENSIFLPIFCRISTKHTTFYDISKFI